MGDNFVYFVNCNPWARPASTNADAACEIIRGAIKHCDYIEISHGEKVKVYFNAEGGWDTFCPRCGRQMAMDDVTDWLSADYDCNTGFQLAPRAMPCCEASLRLNDLAFDPPVAFAKFAIEVKNPKWVFEDEVPSAAEVKVLSELYRRTRLADERWGVVWEAWGEEIAARVDRLAEQVGEALAAPVRVVRCHL